MYSPFLAFLLKKVVVFKQYTDDSEIKDNSVIKLLRGKELSSIQKTGASEIYSTVQNIDIHRASYTDERIYDEIKNQLSIHQTLATQALAQYNEGLYWPQKKKKSTTFLKLLEIFSHELSHAYTLFGKHALIDVPHAQSPLIILKEEAIGYLVYSHAEEKKLAIQYYDFVTNIYKNSTHNDSLSASKRDKVNTLLDRKDLIDTSENVRKYANEIIRQNATLLEQSASKNTIHPGYGPITADITPTVQYGRGELYDAMQRVIGELNNKDFPPVTPSILSNNNVPTNTSGTTATLLTSQSAQLISKSSVETVETEKNDNDDDIKSVTYSEDTDNESLPELTPF